MFLGFCCRCYFQPNLGFGWIWVITTSGCFCNDCILGVVYGLRDQLFRMVACGFLDVSWASISRKSCWMIWGHSHMTWKLSVLPWLPIFWLQNDHNAASEKYIVGESFFILFPWILMIVAPKDRTRIHVYMYISTSLCKLLLVCIFRASSYHPSWKKLEKNGSSPRRSHVKWPDLATLATSHAMAFQRPRVPVFQSHRSVSSVSWMISGIVEQVIIGIWWGKMGCCSGCVSFRSLGAAILEIPLFEAKNTGPCWSQCLAGCCCISFSMPQRESCNWPSPSIPFL